MASNIMLYQDQVLGKVRDMLWRLKQREGKVTSAWVQDMANEFRGGYPYDVCNVALECVGLQIPYPNDASASPQQRAELVAKAKNQNRDLLPEIARMREARKSR